MKVWPYRWGLLNIDCQLYLTQSQVAYTPCNFSALALDDDQKVDLASKISPAIDWITKTSHDFYAI